MKNTATAKQTDQRPFMEELERRLLMSADVFGAFAGNAVYQDVEQPASESALVTESDQAVEAAAAEHQSRELIIIDAATPDYESLLADLTGNADEDRLFEIAVLDPTEDGISQIGDLLSQYSDLDAVHIISHGSEGSINLGSSVLDYDALIDSARDIEGWGDAFAADGDLLIYGCNLAASEEGQDLVDAMARLTETDVAASEDLTGAASLGGDWDLEYQAGNVEAELALSAAARDSWGGILATFTVDTLNDTTNANPGDGNPLDATGDTSLRAAIEEANALGGAHTIMLGAGTYTLSGGELSVTSDLTIVGADAGTTIIDANSTDRVFYISAGSLTLSDATVTGGAADQGAGFKVDLGATLNLSRAVVSNNVTTGAGGGFYSMGTVIADQVRFTSNQADLGGGFTNAGSATITNSLIDGNTAAFGGGIRTTGLGTELTLENVTISGNTATTLAGGIQNSKLATLTNVTITDNRAAQGGGIAVGNGSVSTFMVNTIVAGNTELDGITPNEIDGTIDSLGNNLIGDSTGGGGWVGSDQLDVDPLLGVLADNGGPTLSHALLTGSTAIDAGTSVGAPTTDQRGIKRDSLTDIGAYEIETNNGSAIWGESGTSTPEISGWDGAAFGAEGTTANVGSWRIMQGAESPTRDEKIVVGVDSSGVITGMIWDGTSWTALPMNPLATVSQSYWWGFDVQYEAQSGDAILTWANGNTGTDGISYSTWDGTSWSAAQTITTPQSGAVRQIQLAADPSSDGMILVASNSTSQDYALVWDGNAWGTPLTLDGTGGDDRTDISVAYESLSGGAVVTFGQNSANLKTAVWSGSAWTSIGTYPQPAGVTGDVRWTTLASDPTSDRIALGVLTYNNEIWTSVWDGTTWTDKQLVSSTAPGSTYPTVAVAFESVSGNLVAAYGESGSNTVMYRTWSSGGGWSAELTGPDVGAVPNSMTLASDPASDRIMLSVQDSNSDLNMSLWDSTSWGAVTEHEIDTGEAKNQPFLFLWDQNVIPAPNNVPVITSDGGGDTANVNVAENSIAVTTVAATDADPDTLTYSISGGADGALFGVNGASGALTFLSAPDYETPLDANGDNVYEVIVQVADGNGGFDTQAINVTVTDVSHNLIVTTTANVDDGDTSSAEALNASKGVDNAISLFEAITAANNSTETVTISFNITDPLVGGAHTFTIGAGGLPVITDTVIIDGTTDPDFAGTPIIVLDGSGAGSVDGLTLAAGSDGSTIRGLVINGFNGSGIKLVNSDNHTIVGNYIGTDASGTADQGNSIYGIEIQNSANNQVGGSTAADRNVIGWNGDDGIILYGAGTTNNVVQGNYVGVDATGNAAAGNLGNGIKLAGGATNNTIGGDRTAGEGNVLSGNSASGSDGIVVDDAGTDNNRIFGNYIGTNYDGTAALANARHGVVIYNGAQGNLIGGTGTGEGNIISGNISRGIVIDGNGLASTSGNIIQANLIGLDVTGTAIIANGSDGIRIFGGAQNNTIGGTTAAARNVISGNDDGIHLTETGTNGNVIQGNYIGTDITGTVDLGNSDRGIQIEAGASYNIVGGTTAGARNIISGNDSDGVIIADYNSSGTTGNVVQGNYIGTDVTGTADLGNSAHGVHVTTPQDNVIGGSAVGAGNLIAYNAWSGVLIQDASAVGISILGNEIHSNGGFGIDLGNDNLTPNDSGDGDSGSNDLQNFPILATAALSGTDLTLSGSLDTDGISTQYRIEFFGNAAGTQDATNGEARTYLGAVTVTTDGSGDATFSNVTLSGVTLSAGDYVTATATKIEDAGQVGINDLLAYGSSSEFAANLAIAAGNTAPVLTDGITGTIFENGSGLAPFFINGTVSDADSGDFDGGTLTFSVASGGDGSEGLSLAAFAGVTTSGSDVFVSGVQVGTYTGGAAGTPLVVTFNADATPSRVESVFKALAIRVASEDPTPGLRNLEVVVTDGDGGTSNAATASTTFSAVNDAPVLDNSGFMSLTTITEDDTNNSGDLISAIIASAGGDRITDVDSGAVEGIAILGLVSGNGTWEYNTGSGWTAVGSVSGTSSLLLRATDSLRFVPDGLNSDTGIVTFAAWDQTTGVAGTKVDTSAYGGSTAFSEVLDTAVITVTAVNDVPVITSNGGGAAANLNVAENTTAVTIVTSSDVDGGTPVFSISGGADAALFSLNSTTGELTFIAAPNFEEPADADGDNVYVITVQVADGNGGLDTQVVSVTVTNQLELVVTNTNATGTGSLHEAILNANANVGVTDTITFNIGGGGAQTIAVDAAGLPIITDSVILDATTQPGYSGTPLITLDGSATPAASGINGITLRANDSTVKGFIVINFADEGIEMDGSTGFGDNNTIQNNWVGIDKDGNVAGNAEHGIMISADASGNQIGGTGPNDGNVVAGNGFSGIIINENSDNNIVEGNIIGLKADGTTVAGNGNHGVLITLSSDGNRIGGSTPGARNIISGNSGDGIRIDGATDATHTTAVTGTVILGNYIGTDATGNTQAGSDIQDTGITISASSGNIVGGAAAGDANVLSGNRLRGLIIVGSTSTDNVVSGNFIGTNADGSAALTNVGGGQQIGVYLYDTPGNTIGGTAAGAENVISGNITYGIYAWGPNTTGNEIQGNTIGLDASLSTAIGNGGVGGGGIMLSNAPGNLVGGTDAGAANVISGHLGAGVMISGTGGLGNTLLANEIYDNGSLGIDLGSDGVTDNDADDADTGSNDLQNFPVITSAELSGTDLTLSGTLDTDGIATQYRIEFFGNAAGTEDATNGEAQVYLGAVTVTTDGSGTATFSGVTLSGVTLSLGDSVTATATEIVNPGQVGIDDALAYGSTSEFATNFVITDVNSAPVIISDGGGAAANINVAENTVAVTTVTATDADPDMLSYSIIGGADQALFDINSGVLTFSAAPDFETPADSDGDNVYIVTVQVADGQGGFDTQTINVTVTDADEVAPVVTVNSISTADNTPQLTGTVDDATATVQVTVNGTTYTATNNGDGTWTLADNSIAPALADGTYDVSVMATDGAGNAGTDASTNELTVDATAPVVTVTGISTTDNTPELTGTVNDPAATVQVTVNGTTYAATNNGDGTWTLADNSIAPALADGTYDVSVTATDALGNAGTDGSTNELTVDTTAPLVTVTGLSTVDNTPQLTGTVNDLAATVDVTVNGTTYAATNNGDGTWTLADNSIAPALADGTYDVSVTATDALGNAGTDGSTNELTVDTTAPIVTITGLTTADNTPALTGTVSDSTATVDVTVNGTTYAATNNGDGTWTLADDTIAPALADGTYDVSVTATDSLGNAGSDASIDELVVDTTAPIVTVTGLTTVDNTPALTGTVNDPSATVDVTVNGTTYAATNNGDGTWTLADNTIAPALADGTYDVSVTATDVLGNAGSDGSTNELTVDTTAPIVTITGLTTTDNTPALTGTVSDPTASVDVTVNGTTYAATNNGDGTWTLADNTIAPALADGTYDVSVTATDALSNVGTDGSTNELTVDTTAPIVTVTGLSTVDNTPQLTGTVSDPAATVDVTVNGTTYTATNNGDGTWTLADDTIAPALADGTYDVSITATDALGNAGTDASTNELTVDTTAPIVTVTGLSTVDNTPALTGTVSDPAATVDVTVNGITYAATNNGDGTWTLADDSIAPALADGTYDVSVTATDALGNAGSDASTNELTVDTTAPIVTVTGLTTADNTPALTGTVSDPSASIDVTVNGTTYAATNNGDGTWALADNTIAPALADGTYDVSVTATDALGNAGSDGSTNELTVDTTAPIVTVTGLSTVDNTPALTGTVSDPAASVDVTVNGTTYAATNNGDGTWTLADDTIAPALADGTYDVSVTATDALSNVGTDASVNELTVDTTAPIVTVTGLATVDNTPQLTGTVSDPTATVDVTVNGTTYAATNNGDGTWTLADNIIAPALADGTYDVSVTATDGVGNAGSDASTNELTVDTTAPIVTVTGLTTADNNPALTGTVSDPAATVQVTVNGTTYTATNNGDGTWTLADDSIAPALADGTYDVSVTATDGVGNAGTDASTNELTVDTTAPSVTILGLTTADNTPALTGTVSDPTATVQVMVDGVTYTATNNGDGTWILADNTIAPALADGTYDVSVAATDGVGNTGTDASIDELIVDITAPVVTVTGLTTADNTPALTGTVSDPAATVQVTVNGTTYTATNNGDGTWTLADDTIAPALTDGTYDVSVTATDGVGNIGTDASTNELTVDTTAPVVTVTGLTTADATPQLTGTVSDPAATVQVTVNGTTYTATNNGDGTWTLADDSIAPALADGTYDVSVTATDGVGNVGTDASSNELTVDTTAPVVTITGLTTADNTPALTGTVSDLAATVQVTVNGTTYTATNNGDGTWTLADGSIAPALADGTYDVSVTVTDAVGNAGTDGSVDELLVDTTAPVVTVTGLTTADNTPALTGTVSDPTATVQVTVDGTTYTATNNGDGTWTLADNNIAPALADGTYDVSVTATDGLGNAGTDASTNELTVDTTAPIVTVTGLSTVDNTPALTGTVSDTTATVDVTVNGTTYAATNNGDGTWTLADNTIAPALADGTYDVSVTATDALGNAGTDGSANELTVDTTAPIVTVTGLSTVDNTPQLTGTVSDTTATVDVTVNGTTYAATNNGDGTWTLADDTIAPALVDGTYDVSVTATDALSNVGTDASVNELTVDTTAPIVTVSGLATADNTPQLTGTVSDPTATVDVTVNGTTYAATNNGDGTWTLTDDSIAPALADGTYDVSVTATDGVGNAGSDASTNELTVDTTAPIVTVTGLTTADNTPALTGTVSDPAATVQVTVNGTTYTATNNGDGTWALADDTIAPALADGTYDVSVTATDGVGNVGTDASTNELTVDTTAPVVTVTGLTTADATPQLTGTVSDPAATVQVTVNGTTYTATNNGDGTWTLADDSIAPALADGTYDVSVTATDAVGNAGTDGSVDELLVDTTAPVVTVTGLTTADSTPALTGTVSDPAATVQVTVNGTTYTATNNGDGTWTLADDSIAPVLADGTYDVSVTATDGLGNVGSDASVDELVVDTTAPVVTITGLTTADNTPALTGTVSDPAATVQVTVNGTTYTATNNGDGTWTLADDTIAPALADGTYDVGVTATDGVGNVGTDASTNELTVDTTAPVVTVTGLTTADNTPALTGTISDPTATVQVTVDGTTYTATNNGDGTWTLADDSIGPALVDGTYDVSVTATDGVGNIGTDASSNELTVDTTAPVVTITGLTTADNTPALTGTVSDPTATVQVTVNGTTYTATNNGDGTWTLADDSIAPALADGTYDVSVTATDAVGNAGTDGSVDELLVDTTAPVVTVTGLTTADNTPALTGTISDPTATVQVTVNGTTYTATNNGDGTWTLADDSIAPALADGTYDVSVTATDGVGNVGTDASSNELTVDTTAPVVTITGLTTADNTPALTGTVSDLAATVQVTVNGTTYTATNNGDGTWTLADDSIAPALADGTYDVSVTAADGLGNVGSDASVDELVVDTTAPIVTVTGLTTADNTPALTGTVSDPTATVQVTVNGTTYTATNNGDGTWTLADDSIAPALADGTYDVSVTATDAVGNVGADASVDELIVDTTAPVVTVSPINTADTTPQLTGTVSDPTATVQVTVDGATYTATNNGDGTWTLADDTIAPALAKGTYDVSVTATDAVGNVGADASVDELVILNAPPVAGDDAITTDEDLAFTAVLGLDDLLLNDSDADGDPLTVNTTPVSGPSNGGLILNSDGTFTYTPDADFNGTDSFVYEVSDGDGGVAQATVTITVNPINDGPVAVGDGYTTNEDQSVTAVLGVDDLLLNDSDTEGDSLTVNTTPVVDPVNGTLVLNSDGTFTYTPDVDFSGTDSFTYEITDGNGGTSQAVVSIAVNPVNDAPTTSGIADVSVNEDAPNTTIDLLSAFGDVDDGAGGLSFTVTQNTNPGLFNSNNINNILGSLTLDYAQDANGTADITVRATDSAGAWVETTFSVAVAAINDAPVIGSENIIVDEDVSFLAALGVDDLLLNESDVDGDALSVNTTPVTGPANGSLLLNSDGTFTYTPDANFNGSDSFTYEVTDGNGGLGLGVVTITVNPVNDAPVSADDNLTVDEDSPLSVMAGLSDLLLNDSDADGDVLIVDTTPVTGPSNGNLILNSDGTFTYTPNADFNGTDTFAYRVSDSSGATSQALVNIVVNAINDAPVAAGDALTADGVLTMAFSESDLLANDTDVDGDSLQIVGFTQPDQGLLVQNPDGSFAYTPPSNFTGMDSFSYTVADAAGAQDTVLVMVSVTAPPILIDPVGPPAPGSDPNPEDNPPGDQDSGEPADNDSDDEKSSDGPAGDDPAAQRELPPVIGGGLPASEPGAGTLENVLQQSLLELYEQDDDGVAGNQATPPKSFYDALQAIEALFDVEFPDLSMAALNELPIWKALDAMRNEMNAPADDSQFGGLMVMQMTTGASLVLSAGFVSWILRGGALASALLSTMPMWQGFDPLPILLARKKGRKRKDEQSERDAEILRESEVDRLFEAASQGRRTRDRGRPVQ